MALNGITVHFIFIVEKKHYNSKQNGGSFSFAEMLH